MNQLACRLLRPVSKSYLLRPPGFGKTTLLSALKESQTSALSSHTPTVLLPFATGAPGRLWDHIQCALGEAMRDEGCALESAAADDISGCVVANVSRLAQHTQRRVAVLIDDFDMPLRGENADDAATCERVLVALASLTSPLAALLALGTHRSSTGLMRTQWYPRVRDLTFDLEFGDVLGKPSTNAHNSYWMGGVAPDGSAQRVQPYVYGHAFEVTPSVEDIAQFCDGLFIFRPSEWYRCTQCMDTVVEDQAARRGKQPRLKGGRDFASVMMHSGLATIAERRFELDEFETDMDFRLGVPRMAQEDCLRVCLNALGAPSAAGALETLECTRESLAHGRVADALAGVSLFVSKLKSERTAVARVLLGLADERAFFSTCSRADRYGWLELAADRWKARVQFDPVLCIEEQECNDDGSDEDEKHSDELQLTLQRKPFRPRIE